MIEAAYLPFHCGNTTFNLVVLSFFRIGQFLFSGGGFFSFFFGFFCGCWWSERSLPLSIIRIEGRCVWIAECEKLSADAVQHAPVVRDQDHSARKIDKAFFKCFQGRDV